MWKFIIMTLALSVFAAAGIAPQAEAQYRLCSKAPKNPIPCTAERLQVPKLQGKY